MANYPRTENFEAGISAKDNTSISDALNIHSQTLDILEKGISELTGRLDGILRPSYPEDDSEHAVPMPECSEVQGRISVHTYRVNDLISRIDRIMQRIDL